jgi:hypothetical protein
MPAVSAQGVVVRAMLEEVSCCKWLSILNCEIQADFFLQAIIYVRGIRSPLHIL